MRLKKISEILGRLIDVTMINTNEINDFSIGSTIRSIYEAVAMELEQYYVLGRENILWGIEQGVLNAFDFRKRESQRAHGYVTIQFHTTSKMETYIPTGTQFDSNSVRSNDSTTSRLTYETIEDYVIPAGTVEASVEVYCTTPGAVGNVEAGKINRLINNLSNARKVYNKNDILTGSDEESIESVKKRFHGFVESRGRATIKALNYGTRQVAAVKGVYIREEAGRVRIYAHDSNGNLEDDVREKVQKAIEDYRPAGIKTEVHPVVKTPVNVGLTIYVTQEGQQTRNLENRVVSTVRNYLNNRTVSETLVKNDLLQAVMNLDDELIYDCEFNYPKNNLSIPDEGLIRAGEVRVAIEQVEDYE